MDGLCAGTALVAGGCLLFTLLGEGAPEGRRCTCLRCLARQPDSWPTTFHPATIFMGDTGSLFLGLNLVCFTLLAKPYGHRQAGVLSVMRCRCCCC